MNKVVPASGWARVVLHVRRDLRRAPGQAPAQSSQFWGQVTLLRALIQTGLGNLQGRRPYSLRIICFQVWLSSCEARDEASLVSAYAWLCLLMMPLEVLEDAVQSPGGLPFSNWTGSLLAQAACSLPRLSRPFQQGSSTACHFQANHKQACWKVVGWQAYCIRFCHSSLRLIKHVFCFHILKTKM